VFETSIKTIDEGLSIASKIDAVATNPVTGKLNLKVRDMLYDKFMDDILLKGSPLPPVDSLVEKWATSLQKSLNPMKAAKAEKVLDMLRDGTGNTDEYIKRLTAIDKGGAKQYVPAIRRGVDDASIRKYC
jgi:hypothetical protein